VSVDPTTHHSRERESTFLLCPTDDDSRITGMTMVFLVLFIFPPDVKKGAMTFVTTPYFHGHPKTAGFRL
jgi:hypothetical protein